MKGKNIADFNFLEYIGCTVDKSDKQSAVLSIQIQEKHLQHLGYIHGGVISTLADNTGWFVVQPYLNENQTAMTQELTINYLYPGKGKLLKAVGILVKMGKTTAFVQVDLFCEDKIIATSSSHLAILEANK
ncbi:PaaI family thioesterase [Sulfurimonas sp. MAG313]|nr:PaaI family thioesterase [Sulfurimonas sp. MAG313]